MESACTQKSSVATISSMSTISSISSPHPTCAYRPIPPRVHPVGPPTFDARGTGGRLNFFVECSLGPFSKILFLAWRMDGIVTRKNGFADGAGPTRPRSDRISRLRQLRPNRCNAEGGMRCPPVPLHSEPRPKLCSESRGPVCQPWMVRQHQRHPLRVTPCPTGDERNREIRSGCGRVGSAPSSKPFLRVTIPSILHPTLESTISSKSLVGLVTISSISSIPCLAWRMEGILTRKNGFVNGAGPTQPRSDRISRLRQTGHAPPGPRVGLTRASVTACRPDTRFRDRVSA